MALRHPCLSSLHVSALSLAGPPTRDRAEASSPRHTEPKEILARAQLPHNAEDSWLVAAGNQVDKAIAVEAAAVSQKLIDE